ncbi:zf-HC2 domain-containing protein [Nocardioides caldifontis]|uniref:zf-HC2 domain-containing protein n=1 Tax=Nocardioides caldifontis TaxID=2588938 RepID=UPI0011DFBD34|nr:zf-HC2 domain-containing protein [Nocardioides caldifontis]
MSAPTDSWHLDDELAGRYERGEVAGVLAASVEQHLVGCPSCRALLHADPTRLDAVWARIVEQVQAPRTGLLERVLRALGTSGPTARLVAATPTLRGAWLLSVLVVLLLALLAGHASPRGVVVFVALAPVLPLAGVALAFGQRFDPALEIAAASPYSLVRLLAARTAFVLATTLLPAAAVAPLLPGDASTSLGWLLPGLAMSAGVLAAARRFPPLTTATVLAAAWTALVGWRAAADRPLLLEHGTLVQLVSLAALAVAATVLVRHRHDLTLNPRRTA